ncbi:MAG: hypothetical protein OEZ06_32210 [Myxococcales bacterium]|nr:hypothetical protein [Myxococcales bacterium]
MHSSYVTSTKRRERGLNAAMAAYLGGRNVEVNGSSGCQSTL